MNNKELELLKDKYATNTLTADEHASLQVEILKNNQLESELKAHKDLVNGVQYAGELELRDVLDKIHYQQSETKDTAKPSSYRSFIIAGTLLLLAFSAYFIIGNRSQKEINPSKIYADFYTQYQPSIQDRGANIDEAITEFNNAYADQKFKEAINIIKPFLSESNNTVKLTAAIAANENNNPVLAEHLLNEIIESKDYYFVDHAIWYKVLIKLKNNDTTAIKEILTPLIINPKADHHEEAKQLISELSEL